MRTYAHEALLWLALASIRVSAFYMETLLRLVAVLACTEWVAYVQKRAEKS